MTRAEYRLTLWPKAYQTSLMAHMAELWQGGMDLLKQIHAEEKTKLDTIWNAPDADETQKELFAPAMTSAQMEKVIAEIEPEFDRKLSKKTASIIAANRIAKAELKAGGEI
jgi:hypothetical protein